MSISVDTVNLRFNVKPDYDQQQLQQLQQDLKDGQRELEKTRKAMDKLSKNGLSAMTKEEREEFNKLSSALSKQASELHAAEKRMQDYTRSANINKLSVQQLGQRAKDLSAVLNNLNPNTDDFKEYKAELDSVKNRMKELKSVAQDTEESFGKWDGIRSFVGKLNVFGFAVINTLAIKDRIVQWADQYVQSFAQMDDAMTDVMKYTGQTKREVEEMNETFKQMTTRTPREELNALAGAAGRLGIQGRKDIEGFVDAADKINVALGDDLGEGAIDQIGKLTMVFGEDKTKGLNGAMLATGSAINVLGANSSANTGFITEFTSSMAGMAVNARISQTDIMGYASALSQAGIEGQTASGVFAQLITKMFTDPARFAKAARLDVKSFTDLLKTDANAAILQFLEGLKRNGGFDALAPALKSLKMQGTQAVPVISSLINKMDELKKAQQDARQAYDEGTSIIDEFNNANSSAAAKLEIAKKRLNDVSVELGQKLMPIVEGSITASTSVLKILSSIVGVIASNIKAFVQLTVAIAAYTVATNAASISTSRFVVSARSALTATRQWFATLTANPIGLVAAALTLFVGEIVNYINRARKASQIQGEMNEAMREAKKEIASEREEMNQLIGTVKSATSSEDERREALEKLNGKLMSQHLGNLTEEMVRTGDLTTVLDAYNRKLETSIKLKRLQAQQEDLINQKIDLEEGGYEDDISFVDRAFQGLAATGQAMISGHVQGFGTAFSQEWDRVEDSFKNRALRPILEGLDTVQDKIAQIKADEEKAANTVNYVGEVVVTPGHKDKESSSGSGGGTSDKEQKKEKAERDRQRKELEAQAKAAYEREKLVLRQQYQGKKQLQDEWHQKEYDAETRYLARIGQLRDEYNADESEKMEVQNKIMDNIIREANLQEERRKRQQQESLKTIDRYQAEEELLLARQMLTGELQTQEEFNQKKLEVEIKYQKMRIEHLKAGSAEYLAAQKQLLSMELQQQQAGEKEKEQFMKSYHDTGNQSLQNVMSDLGSFDERLEMNQAYYDADLISFEQYQQNKTAIEQEQSEARTAITQAAMDTVNQAMAAAQQLFQVSQQRETNAVEKKYKKLIEQARKNGKDTTKLEEQKEAEINEIRKKYAQKQFKLQILQIIAATAQSIANIWKEWGAFPAVAAALTALAAAQGTIQLATAKAQADQAEGLYSGGYSDEYQEGYTRKGDPKKQAGVIPVHRNEFVANHKAVANPEVRPVLDVIDRHQKAGDISMLNATKLLEEAYGHGRYRGGYTQGNDDEDTAGNEKRDQQNIQSDITDILRRIEENTSDALTIREVRDAIRRQERLEQNAHR